MANDTTITLVGNLVDDPELRFTPSGVAVARFRVASNPRFFDKQANEWKDGEGLFLTCNVWREMAENVCESLTKGTRIIVQGRLRQRSYEAKDGGSRTVYEVEVDAVGPDLRSATTVVTKQNRAHSAPGAPEWENAARVRPVSPQAQAVPVQAVPAQAGPVAEEMLPAARKSEAAVPF